MYNVLHTAALYTCQAKDNVQKIQLEEMKVYIAVQRCV